MRAALVALFAGTISYALLQSVPAADGGTFKESVLYSFCDQDYCPNGAYSQAGVIDLNGLLYGTTAAGGHGNKGCEPAGCGTAFSLDPSNGTEKVLHYFCSRRKCADGGNPNALMAVNGTVYGTTGGGGRGFMGQRYGTAFTLDPQTGAEKVLHSFCQQRNCPDGGDPSAGLLAAKGKLYGVTVNGGATFFGTAFALDPKSGAVIVLYSFCSLQNCTDGRNPGAPLIEVNGMLYGTTTGGGVYCGGSCGVAFSIDPDTGVENVIHSFGDGADAEGPHSLIAVSGMLYGTSYGGGGITGCGAYGCGTVFSIDPNTGAERVLHSFCSQQNCADGSHPFAGLIGVKGMLYGTTGSGGGSRNCYYGCGTVFSVDPNTGVETILYAFRGGTDGAIPAASLSEAKGTLYGTTDAGGGTGCYGGYGCGTVFALSKKR